MSPNLVKYDAKLEQSVIYSEIRNDRYFRKYGILMRFIYYLRLLAVKHRFKRSRMPLEMKDVEKELHEMELQRLAKLKEVRIQLRWLFRTVIIISSCYSCACCCNLVAYKERSN